MSLGHYTSALLGILVCLGLQLWILRPAGPLRWARGSQHSLWLALARGLINGVGVSFGLTQVGYPAAAALAEGIAAGSQSGYRQVSWVNERFCVFLNGARSEARRFWRWALLEGFYWGAMKSVGALFGGGPSGVGDLAVMYARTLFFATSQYPWVCGIALARQLRTEQGNLTAAQIRRITDVQSAVLSAASICLCALNSVGVPSSKLLLLGLGLIGGAYYLATRLRYAAWQRRLRPGAALAA
jgi:hypothetical protein